MEAAPRDESLPKFQELIEGIDTATLTTVDKDGNLRSRPMAALPMNADQDSEGDLWFFTDDGTAKVEEVMLRPQVCVTYALPEKKRFVSISGTAELVRERPKLEKLWRPELKTWFPRGLDDPALALLHVSVVSGQYWDAPSSRLVRLVHRMKAATTGAAGAQAGETQKLTLKTRIGSDSAT